jgi:hypothetical protein
MFQRTKRRTCEESASGESSLARWILAVPQQQVAQPRHGFGSAFAPATTTRASRQCVDDCQGMK